MRPQLYRVVKKAVPWPTGVFQEDKVLYRERVWWGVSLPPQELLAPPCVPLTCYGDPVSHLFHASSVSQNS